MGDVLEQFWEALDRLLPFIPEPWRQVVGVAVPALVIVFVLIGLARWAFKRESTERSTVVNEQNVEKQLLRGNITEGAARLLLERIAARKTASGQAPISAETGEAFVKAAVEIGQEGDAAEREALTLLAEGRTAEAERRLETDIAQAAGQAIEKLRRKGALFAPTDTHVAKDAYERLLALAPSDLNARNELGYLLARLGDLAGAQSAYQAVLDAARGDKATEAAALGNLGIVARTRGDLAAAEDFHRRALALNEALGHKLGMAIQLANLGVIAAARGDKAGARALYERALALFVEMGAGEGEGATIARDNLRALDG
jgi:tetratricopeptide (TPR) repeat protein